MGRPVLSPTLSAHSCHQPAPQEGWGAAPQPWLHRKGTGSPHPRAGRDPGEATSSQLSTRAQGGGVRLLQELRRGPACGTGHTDTGAGSEPPGAEGTRKLLQGNWGFLPSHIQCPSPGKTGQGTRRHLPTPPTWTAQTGWGTARGRGLSSGDPEAETSAASCGAGETALGDGRGGPRGAHSPRPFHLRGAVTDPWPLTTKRQD